MNKLAEEIEDYLRYSQIERGLSPNTIAAYQQDLLEFLAYVKKSRCPPGRWKQWKLMLF